MVAQITQKGENVSVTCVAPASHSQLLLVPLVWVDDAHGIDLLCSCRGLHVLEVGSQPAGPALVDHLRSATSMLETLSEALSQEGEDTGF